MPSSGSLAPPLPRARSSATDEDAGADYDDAPAQLMMELQQEVERLQGELAHEKAKAKEIIVQLKREVEVVLQESEAATAEAREGASVGLAAAESELAAQRANVEWLGTALERAEERARGYESQLAAAGAEQAAERVAAAVAKARAPLELRNEGLAAQVRSLTAELETERRRYSELQRKSREVPQLEAAVLALQRELADETSRGIGMEEQLSEALEAEKARAAAALDVERSAHAKAVRAKDAEVAAAVAAAERAGSQAASAARAEADAARAALEAEQARSSKVKERLKAEVVSVMAQREGALVEHNSALQAALAEATAAAAAERQRAASAAAAAEEARSRCRELERGRGAGPTGGEGGAPPPGSPAYAAGVADAEAAAARLAQELDAEKAYSRELERQLHEGGAAAAAASAAAARAAGGEPGAALAAAHAALEAEKARSRDTIQHLTAEAAAARALAAQLKGEIEVQALVIARTEAVVEAKHALAAEVKKLRSELEAEQERARATELQLIGEVEVLMRELPGTLRARSTAGSGAGSIAGGSTRPGAPQSSASWA